MAATSKQQELERISVELHKLTLHRQQLNNRLQILGFLKEFRKNAGYHKEGQGICFPDSVNNNNKNTYSTEI